MYVMPVGSVAALIKQPPGISTIPPGMPDTGSQGRPRFVWRPLTAYPYLRLEGPNLCSGISTVYLRRTFQIDTVCPACKSPLRLIALIKTDDTIKKILSAMGLPCPCEA